MAIKDIKIPVYVQDADREALAHQLESVTKAPADFFRSIESYTEAVAAVRDSGMAFGDTLWDSAKTIGTGDLTAYDPLTGAVGDAVGRSWESIRKQARERLLATKRVKIKELLRISVSSSSYTWKEFASMLGGRATELWNSIPEVASQLARELGEDVMNDPEVQDTFFALNEVRAAGEVVMSIISLYTSVQNVMDKFEPFIPYINIARDAALVFWSGGASLATVISESAQKAVKELQKAIPLLIKPLKDYILNAEVEVYTILLGELQRMAAAAPKPVSEWDALLAKSKELHVISDAYYTEVTKELWAPGSDMYRYQATQRAMRQFKSTVLGSEFIDRLVRETRQGKELTYWTDNKDALLNAVVVPAATATSPAAALVPFSTTDVLAISKRLYDALNTEGMYYANRELHSAIVAEFQKDGVVVDPVKRTYDEEATYNGGTGDRLMFKKVNDKIISYHKILQALTGETRADINETIPVIDFFRKDYTGLLYKYTCDVDKPTSLDFQTIRRVIDEIPTDSTAPTTAAMSNPDGNPLSQRSLINLALSSYDVALPFYGTTSSLSVDSNLLVEWGNVDEPRASGLLNGLFTSVGDYSTEGDVTRVSRWRWYDDAADDHTARAAAIGLTLPKGVRYNDAHIVGRGTVVPYPLVTTDPDFGGKAEEIFQELSNICMDQIGLPYATPDLATWKTRGGVLDMVTIYDHWKITENKHYETYEEWVDAGWWWPFGWVKKKRTAIREVTTRSSRALYPYKVKYFSEAEGRLGAALWNTNVDPGVKLHLDSRNGSTRVEYSSITRSEKACLNELRYETSPTTLFHVIIDRRLSSNQVRQVSVITPLEALRNDDMCLNGKDPDTALLVPDSFRQALENLGTSTDRHYLPATMYLVSNYDMGFSATPSDPNNLCTFVGNDSILGWNRHKDAILFCKVAAIEVAAIVQPVVEVTTPEGVFTTNLQSVYSPHSVNNYIYTLSCLSLQYADANIDVYPLRSGDSFLLGNSVSMPGDVYGPVAPPKAYELEDIRSFGKLIGGAIVAGLPPAGAIVPPFPSPWYAYQRINRAPHISLAAIDTYFANQAKIGRDALQAAIRDIPIITKTVNGAERPLTLSKIADVMQPWLDLKPELATLENNGLITTATRNRFNAIIDKFEKLHTTFTGMFAQGSDLTLDQCRVLDRLLGNAAQAAGTPWLSVGPASTDMISEEELEDLANQLRLALEGSSDEYPFPVRCLPGDKFAVGRTDSLYYQRYLFLNNRMHKTQGHLAKAANLLKNWQIIRDALTQDNEALGAYGSFMEIAPAIPTDDLVYIEPDDERTRLILQDGKYQASIGSALEAGKFYSRTVLNHVRDNINAQCLLVCRPCPVKDTCPFYDEEALVLSLVPEQTMLDLWLKDNELDLLAYEPDGGLDLFDVDNQRMDASVIKNRHKQYVEIIHDATTDQSLQVVRDELTAIQGFSPTTGQYVEDFGWLQGGRYGSVTQYPGKPANEHSYLFDAVFIDDTESEFIYNETQTRYPVTVDVQEGIALASATKRYTGTVRIKVPVGLRLLQGAGENSEVYLVSDDANQNLEGNKGSVVYLNTVKNLRYVFDLREDDPAEEILSADDPWGPRAKDIAQWSVNYYKKYSSSPDQWWMNKITKVVNVEGVKNPIVTIEGRRRVATVVDTLISEEMTVRDVLRGRPAANVHHNFLRKVSFDMSSFLWSKGGTEADVERAKKILATMKSNLRLVVVKK